jgi:transcriptional regulator with XRE-family HTH domain
MTLGARIEQVRQSEGLGVNELARKADMSSGYLSVLERDGYRHTSVFVVRRIARALDTTIDELMERVDDPT